tara:strand:- start:1434 stop:1874 length:441 start_codon:yes stop_codon:yes gene_type:complete
MAKKVIKTVTTTTSTEKKRTKKKRKSSPKKIEKTLVENLVELQKVHTDLAEKFDSLSKQLSDLLALFEVAARSFSKHPAIKSTEKDKDFLEKIDQLLAQNKTIAKGLTLMEERVRGRIYEAPTSAPQQEGKEQYFPSQTNRPLPRF